MEPIVLGELADGELVVDLPVLIESRMLVQAQSGAGKSWALRRLLEQTHGRVQQIIIDPEGEFGTLREKYDYVLAGKGGDTPAEPRSAKLLARRLYELGVSAIIDLSELHRHEQVRFVKLFLEALLSAPKDQRHTAMVVIDESHIFCPQTGQAESGQAVIDLCTLGRKRGLCAVLATQRLSKLNKDAAAELRNKLIGATGLASQNASRCATSSRDSSSPTARPYPRRSSRSSSAWCTRTTRRWESAALPRRLHRQSRSARCWRSSRTCRRRPNRKRERSRTSSASTPTCAGS